MALEYDPNLTTFQSSSVSTWLKPSSIPSELLWSRELTFSFVLVKSEDEL